MLKPVNGLGVEERSRMLREIKEAAIYAIARLRLRDDVDKMNAAADRLAEAIKRL